MPMAEGGKRYCRQFEEDRSDETWTRRIRKTATVIGNEGGTGASQKESSWSADALLVLDPLMATSGSKKIPLGGACLYRYAATTNGGVRSGLR